MYDIAIIGGGINGCGIARDAAGRGYTVLLAEMDDLARGTSSASTKLIHGGLRYLEHHEFRLVREALIEREVLWAMAPHIIWPLRFVLPHHAELRPAWLLRLGLFLYDHIGGRRRLPPTRVLDLGADAAGAPLKPFLRKGFEYSDCWVDDARLVVLNARDAATRGATIRTRTRVTGLRRDGGHWSMALRDQTTGATDSVAARLVVNAAGPWVDPVLGEVLGRGGVRNVRLVRGSHIVVPRLYDHDRCYILQNRDGRIVFTIPYQDAYTLIGTTDRDHDGDPGEVAITDEEIDYLCAAVGQYLKSPVDRGSIVWTYAGVRPLYNDGASKAQEATRDYVLVTDGQPGEPALINIFGGKITTYRKLAEAVLARVEGALGAKGAPWTAASRLPGGDFPMDGFESLARSLAEAHPFLGEGSARRLARAYGTLAWDVLSGARAAADLGEDFGAGLTEREVAYLVRHEWARTAEDVLWRRTKLGLRLDAAHARRLNDWLDAHRAHVAASAA